MGFDVGISWKFTCSNAMLMRSQHHTNKERARRGVARARRSEEWRGSGSGVAPGDQRVSQLSQPNASTRLGSRLKFARTKSGTNTTFTPFEQHKRIRLIIAHRLRCDSACQRGGLVSNQSAALLMRQFLSSTETALASAQATHGNARSQSTFAVHSMHSDAEHALQQCVALTQFRHRGTLVASSRDAMANKRSKRAMENDMLKIENEKQ